MPNLTRKLQKIGSSLLITIPSNWAKNINLQKGDSISIEDKFRFIYFYFSNHPRRDSKRSDYRIS